ncbi:hypothetical protein [Clostridium beijerinckii]|uniref:Uncharacterized protein n=1 Tax=Clostridium beijerinckii TaxID=1520 RepID=A0AAE5H6C4_CLOBE|nr:hypothetical protein [Clostridium beijerinckii]NSB15322.1 hypothetical protein [Clostridium beijerinckii]OOM21912.1 hypothetical protein CLOBE_45450 [Clostridium beijerinckii]
MGNIINKFENETKTRVNVIDLENLGKSQLQKVVIKDGIFEETDFLKSDNYISFPTEMLCSSTKSNFINVYLCLKNELRMVEKLKDEIIKSLYEAYLVLDNDNCVENDNFSEEGFKKAFYNSLNNEINNVSLIKFYEVNNIQNVFKDINFNELLIELGKINSFDDSDNFEEKDEHIWKSYFEDFKDEFHKHYSKWLKMISKYYEHNEEGHEYANEAQDYINKFLNRDFRNLCNVIYGTNTSCDLMVERAYIKLPASKARYLGIIFIDCPKGENIAKTIENRVGEDYKELFMVISKCSNNLEHLLELKENINATTLKKRIFYVLNEFELYKNHSFENDLLDSNSREDLIDTLKYATAKKLGIKEDKVIVTEQFKDINKRTLDKLDTHNDFVQLLRLIRKESERLGNPIKIKSSNKDGLISISLNQERMIVQALMGMLYERYNGYLVDQWKRIIGDENEKIDRKCKKYTYSEINTIIRNRKDNYKEYKVTKCLTTRKDNKPIDFSMRSGDYTDSKRILKMMVDYGYQTVGFNPNENKILVSVNGEISKEDKEKLIKSIKGRLEENAINYFESAFLANISRKKFNTNNLYKALEIETNITMDDFYSAFKEMFKKISDNIVRYEVRLQ